LERTLSVDDLEQVEESAAGARGTGVDHSGQADFRLSLGDDEEEFAHGAFQPGQAFLRGHEHLF